jgi:hypothetical protein
MMIMTKVMTIQTVVVAQASTAAIGKSNGDVNRNDYDPHHEQCSLNILIKFQNLQDVQIPCLL